MSKFKSIIQLSVLVRKILFGGKFFYFLFAAAVFIGIVIFVNYADEEESPLTLAQSLIVLMMLPMSVLAVYLSMIIIPQEKEMRTIETLFSMPGSRYRIWLVKIAVMFVFLSIFLVLFESLTFFLVTDLDFFETFWHVMPSVYFLSGLTFYFSVKTKSSNAAGMLTGLVVFFIVIFADPLHRTPYFLYLNPYDKPRAIDPSLWSKYVFQNHIGLFAIGTLFFYFGLNKLLQRERIV